MRVGQSGLLEHDATRAYRGFTTVAPLRHHSCYLIDMSGATVHQWALPGPLASNAYLLTNGNLLCAIITEEGTPIKSAKGGHMLELDWSGNIVWEHIDHDQHHDFRRLENGNTVYLAWEELSANDIARISGGVPDTERDGKIYGDVIREVTQHGATVWEWHFKDVELEAFPLAIDCQRDEWAHANSLAPTPDGNYLINFRHLDTMMVVSREDGEILWQQRDPDWGHPHHAEMQPNGNITFLANGMNNLVQPLHSRAMELDPSTGDIIWFYRDPQKWTFFSPVMGGVQRLANGNTLICEATNGRIFEVTADGYLVWDFINPYFLDIPIFDGPSNACFRAYRYAPESPEIGGRVG